MNTSSNRSSSRRLMALLFLLFVFTAIAHAEDSLSGVLDAYLRTQTQGLPGKVSYSIGQLDPRTQLAPCSAFEPFLPNGSRLWGKATVGVRCLGPASWTIYVPVQVQVSGQYLVAARPLPAGRLLSSGDLVVRSGDLGALPASIVTEAAQAVGKTIRNGMAAGQPLRSDQLLAPWAVHQGQNVRLVSKGAGFSVSSEGKALNNAAEGQIAQVRTGSGQTVSGVARSDGVVEISY